MSHEVPSIVPRPDLRTLKTTKNSYEAFCRWWNDFVATEINRYRSALGPTIDSWIQSSTAARHALLHSNPAARQGALFVLEHMHDRSLDVITDCMRIIQHDTDEAVRTAAISYLVNACRHTGQPDICRVLAQVVVSEHESADMRLFAYRAILTLLPNGDPKTLAEMSFPDSVDWRLVQRCLHIQ